MTVASLEAARDDAEAELAAVYAAGSKTSYSVDGRSFSHDQHVAQLLETIDKLNALIIKRNPAAELRTSILG